MFPSWSQPSYAFVTANSRTSVDQDLLWHGRLGYPTYIVMSKALSSCNSSVHIQQNKMFDCCVYCSLAKSHQFPFSLSISKASSPLELLHMDL